MTEHKLPRTLVGTPPKRVRRRTGRATLEDVARLAGVSAQTVSRVINSPESVVPSTVAHVRLAIAEAAYVPRRPVSPEGRSRLVAVLVPAIASPVFQQTLEALIQKLAANGYQVMLGESGYDDVDELQLLDNLISREPDGIVLTRVVESEKSRQRLARCGIPVVESWDLTPHPVDMLIGFSHEKVGEAVADLMAERGIRWPALVTGNDPRAQRRRRGFVNRLAALGLVSSAEAVPVAEVAAPAPMGSGRRGLRELLQRGVRFDGVFCSTDTLALGALIEANERGIRVPGELGVVGFGDLVFAGDTSPALTTVRIDGRSMGHIAAEMIIDRVNGRPVLEPTRDVGYELVRRASI